MPESRAPMVVAFLVVAGASFYLGGGEVPGGAPDAPPPPPTPVASSPPTAPPTPSAPPVVRGDALPVLARVPPTGGPRDLAALPGALTWREGPKLWRLASSGEPELLAEDLIGSELRLRGARAYALAGDPPALLEVPGAGAPTRHALAGAPARELYFVYPDGETLVVEWPARKGPGARPVLVSTARGPIGPVPRPPGCEAGELLGMLPQGRAALACGEALVLGNFTTPLPHTREVGTLSEDESLPGGPAPRWAAPEAYLWPVLALRGPGRDRLQPLVTGAVAYPQGVRRLHPLGEGGVLAEVEREDHSRTVELLAPGWSRPVARFAEGEVAGAVAWLRGPDWVVWREGDRLAVLDRGQRVPAGTLRFEGELAVVPGRHQGQALPLLRTLGDSRVALDWLVRGPRGAPRLVAGPRGLPGRPVSGGSAPGEGGAWLLTEAGEVLRAEAPGESS